MCKDVWNNSFKGSWKKLQEACPRFSWGSSSVWISSHFKQETAGLPTVWMQKSRDNAAMPDQEATRATKHRKQNDTVLLERFE